MKFSITITLLISITYLTAMEPPSPQSPRTDPPITPKVIRSERQFPALFSKSQNDLLMLYEGTIPDKHQATARRLTNQFTFTNRDLSMQEKILLIQAFVCPKIAEWQMLNNREQSRNLRALAFNLPPEEAAFVTRRIPTLRIEIDGT